MAFWNRDYYNSRKHKWVIKDDDTIFKELVAFIRGNDITTICDAGCGVGHWLKALKREFPNKEFYGLDFVNDAIQMCKEDSELEGVSFIEADILNFPNIEFDLIFEINVLRHIPKWSEALAQIGRHCKCLFGYDYLSVDKVIVMEERKFHDKAVPVVDFEAELSKYFKFFQVDNIKPAYEGAKDINACIIRASGTKQTQIKKGKVPEQPIKSDGVIASNVTLNMMKKKFVVIMPCRNAEKYIRDAILSILTQDCNGFGLIIIDDFSTDRTLRKIKSALEESTIPHIVYRTTERKFALYNIDFAITRFITNPNAIIGIVDGDDQLLTRNAISQAMNVYDSTDYDVVWTLHKNSRGIKGVSKKVPLDCKDIWASGNFGASHFKTFRKSVYDKVDKRLLKSLGHWFQRAYDRALMLPMMEISKKWYMIPEYLYRLNHSEERYHDPGTLCPNRRGYRQHLQERKFNINQFKNRKILYVVNHLDWCLGYEALEIKKYVKKYRPDWTVDVIPFREFHLNLIDMYDLVHASVYKSVVELMDGYDSRIVAAVHSFGSIKCDDPASDVPKDIIAKLDQFGNITTINKMANRLLSKKKERIYLTSIGIDPEAFYPVKEIEPFVNDDYLTIGWCGIPREDYQSGTKGYQSIIEPAVKILEKEGIKFLGAYGDRGKDGKFECTFDRGEMKDKFYNQIDVYINASLREGNPNSVLEAAACGIPPVTTAVGVTPEIIKHKFNGMFIERDVTPLVDAILFLKKNKDLLYEMKKRVHKVILAKRSWDIVIHSWLNFWEDSMATSVY